MNAAKKKRIEAKGWKIGDVDEYLDLDKSDLAIIDMKVALAEGIRTKREKDGISQARFAKAIGSSQSRINKMEHADPSVSLELMIKASFALGLSKKQIARTIS